MSLLEDQHGLADLIYLQVSSNRNPKGDIRGQLTSIDYIDSAQFTSFLSNRLPETESNATGCVIISYDCDTSLMEVGIIIIVIIISY